MYKTIVTGSGQNVRKLIASKYKIGSYAVEQRLNIKILV